MCGVCCSPARVETQFWCHNTENGAGVRPHGLPMPVLLPPQLTCRPPSLLGGCRKTARRRMLTPVPKSPFYSPKAAVSPHGRAEEEAQRRPPRSRPPSARQPFPPHRAGAAAAGAGVFGFHIPSLQVRPRQEGCRGREGTPVPPRVPLTPHQPQLRRRHRSSFAHPKLRARRRRRGGEKRDFLFSSERDERKC